MKPFRKYEVDVFFIAYGIFCGEILNDTADFITSFRTMAKSKKHAENNVRFRFFDEWGDNGHPHTQFMFVANEIPSFEVCNHVKAGKDFSGHLVKYCEIQNSCKTSCNCESCEQFDSFSEAQT